MYYLGDPLCRLGWRGEQEESISILAQIFHGVVETTRLSVYESNPNVNASHIDARLQRLQQGVQSLYTDMDTDTDSDTDLVR